MNSGFLDLYLKEHNEDISGRLNSRDRHVRQSAYFEVFCYSFFRKKGFSIDLHPPMTNNKCPDFEIYNEKISFYLESTVIAGEKCKKLEDAQNRIVTYLEENLKKCNVR